MPIRAAPRSVPASTRATTFAEARLGRVEELDPLAGPLDREGRVAAHDEALARERWVADLGEVALVEQAQLEGASLREGADGRSAQGADPVQAGGPERLDPRRGQHPSVAHEDDPLEAEADAQLVHGSRHGRRIAGVARHDLDRDRSTGGVGEQAVLDLEGALLAVPRVAELGERTVAALHVARGQVVEDEATRSEVAGREARLDPGLARAEPVERRVQLVLGRPLDAQRGTQGGLGQPPGGGELGARRQQAGHEHPDHEVALPAPAGVDEALEPRRAQAAQHRRHVTVGQAPADLHAGRRQEPLTRESAPDEVDELGRQVAQVADRLGLHLAVLAVRPAQQVGLVHPVLVVPAGGRDVDRAASRAHARIIADWAPDVNPFSAYFTTVRANTITLSSTWIRAHTDECDRWNFRIASDARTTALHVMGQPMGLAEAESRAPAARLATRNPATAPSSRVAPEERERPGGRGEGALHARFVRRAVDVDHNRRLEIRLTGLDGATARSIIDHEDLGEEKLDAALLIKLVAGQINVLVHAVGIVNALPYLLEKGEVVESVSLGAGNSGRKHDLETDRRVAEFKFIRWRGADAVRQDNLFADLFNLATNPTDKTKLTRRPTGA